MMAMYAPLRTCRSPLHTTLRQGHRLNFAVRPEPFRASTVRSFASTPESADVPKQRSRALQRTLTFCRYSGYFLLSSAFGVVAIGAGIFIHDAFTYADKHVDKVPISPLALRPENGGPKNLPVIKALMDDDEDEENRKLAKKPRLIIVGGGWGVSFVRIRHVFVR